MYVSPVSSTATTGTAPKGTAISAMFFFTPDKASLAQKKCNFPDDDYNMNGKDHVTVVNAKIANGQYEIDYSMMGIQGQCRYVLTEIDVNITGNKVFEDVTLSPLALAPTEDDLASPVKDASPMYCDSSVGWCQSDRNAQIYSFTPQDQKITIDFKDISEKPVDADSDGQ